VHPYWTENADVPRKMRLFLPDVPEIEALPHQEYMKFVHRFMGRDWQSWDHELRRDSKSGDLDFLIKEAMA